MSENRAENRTENEYLIEELTAIRKGEVSWNDPRGYKLLTLTRQKLAGTARVLGFAPEDAVTAAWEVWTSSDAAWNSILTADNPWALTRVSVANKIKVEAYAQAALTSNAGLKRVGFEDFVGMAGESLETLDEWGQLPAALDAELDGLNDDQHTPYQLDSFNQVYDRLISHGHSVADAELVVERLMVVAAGSVGSMTAAEKAARRDADAVDLTGIIREEWTAIASAVFGSSRGARGLLEAEITGTTADQAHMERTWARFDRVLVAA